MLVEELGLTLKSPSAVKAAATTLIAFVVIGLIPLLAFLFNTISSGELANPYLASTLLTGVAFFLVGAAKSLFVDQAWYRSGLQTLAIGGGAAGLAYFVGVLLAGVA